MLGMLARASDALERRFSPATGSEEVWRRGGWLQAADSFTGRAVTPDTALQLVTVYACVRVISETIASLPLITYRRLPGGGKERAVDHPLWPLLHHSPNPEMTRVEFWEALIAHLCLWGNAYASIERDSVMRVKALWPLAPDRIAPMRGPGGELGYRYRLASGEERLLLGSDIMHLRGLSRDGVRGLSPIALAREAVGLGLAAEEFGARFFGNGAQAGGVLQHPGSLSDDAERHIRDSWESLHKGLDNAHRVAILEEGMTYQRVGIPPNEAQFLETRKYQTTEIARLYRVPPHMVQDLERATFTNIEHQSIDFVVHTLRPWTVRIELGIERDLLPPSERRTIFVEWLVDGLLRGDMETRYRAYNTARMGGWMNADDILELENRNPLPDGVGTTYWAPLNMMNASDLISGGSRGTRALEQRALRPSGNAESRRLLAQRHQALFRDAAQRVVRRETNDLRALVERHLFRRDATTFLDAATDYEQQTVAEAIRQTLSGAYLLLAEAAADDARAQLNEEPAPFDAEMSAFVVAILDGYANAHAERSLAQLQQIINAAIAAGEDPAEPILERLQEWADTRAEKIGTNETYRLVNAIAHAMFGRLGVRRLVWATSGTTNCPFCSRMRGRTVSLTETFMQRGDSVDPGDGNTPLTVRHAMKHPPLHGHCDCGINPA